MDAGGTVRVSVDVTNASDRDRAQYPFLLPEGGDVTFRVDKAVSGVGDTPVPNQPAYRVRPDAIHEQTVVLRPLTPAEARRGLGRGPLVPPEGTVVAVVPELILFDQAGVASLPVEVTNQTDAAVRDVTVRVELPDGTVMPEVVELGQLAAGESRTVHTDLSWPGEVVARDTRVVVVVSWTAAGQAAQETTATRQLRVTCAETPTSPAVVTFVDSEETVGEDGAAVNAIDGNPGTIWHTQWQGGSPEHPHEIQLDLGQVMDVCALHYLPRQDSNLNGAVADYEIYLSEDGESWGDPVASGTFASGTDEKWLPFVGTPARYVRFVALSEVNGGPWTSAAELSLDALPG